VAVEPVPVVAVAVAGVRDAERQHRLVHRVVVELREHASILTDPAHALSRAGAVGAGREPGEDPIGPGERASGVDGEERTRPGRAVDQAATGQVQVAPEAVTGLPGDADLAVDRGVGEVPGPECATVEAPGTGQALHERDQAVGTSAVTPDAP